MIRVGGVEERELRVLTLVLADPVLKMGGVRGSDYEGSCPVNDGCVCALEKKGCKGDMERTLDIRGRQDEATCCKFGETFFERGINDHVTVHAVLCRCGGWLCVDRHLVSW